MGRVGTCGNKSSPCFPQPTQKIGGMKTEPEAETKKAPPAQARWRGKAPLAWQPGARGSFARRAAGQARAAAAKWRWGGSSSRPLFRRISRRLTEDVGTQVVARHRALGGLLNGAAMFARHLAAAQPFEDVLLLDSAADRPRQCDLPASYLDGALNWKKIVHFSRRYIICCRRQHQWMFVRQQQWLFH